jgi:hypothetical protein
VNSSTTGGYTQTVPTDGKQFVDVTLTNKTFRNKRWAGICLPFSVSETQMKEVFGDSMQLITVDSVMASEGHKRCLHFTKHVNQLLEAGRPYFIYPNIDGKEAGVAICDTDNPLKFSSVSLEKVAQMTDTLFNDSVIAYNVKNPDDTINIFTYRVTGIYDMEMIPWYSYYMKSSADESENKLYRVVPKSGSTATGANLVGFNCYLFPYSSDPEGNNLVETTETTSSKIASFWLAGAEYDGGTVTAIDELVEDINVQSTAIHPGVYDLQGHCLRTNNNLEGLAPGVYIMGGKKYLVK